MTGYFKLSDNNRLFFLWASSVTLEPTHLPQEAIDSLGTISGRYSPPIMLPKFLGSNKNALDDKEDVVGYIQACAWHPLPPMPIHRRRRLQLLRHLLDTNAERQAGGRPAERASTSRRASPRASSA